MYQTNRGDNYFRGTAGPGTTVISDRPATIKRIVWGGTYVGTTVLHDASSAGGTTATSAIVTLGIPLLQYPKSLELNLHCKNGIVVQETGTPAHTIIWGE